MPSSSAVATVTISSTVFVTPSPVVSSSIATTASSSAAASSALPTCYRTDLGIGPLATGLPNIACVTNQADNDDFFQALPLPFNVSIFGTTASNIFISTNGVSIPTHPNSRTNTSQFITTGVGSSQYNHQHLPTNIFDSGVTGIIMPYWTDLAFDLKTTATTSMGAYYILTSTSVAIEWVSAPNYDDTQPVIMSVSYSTATPGAWTFRYYNMFDSGASGTVGIQGPGGSSAQYLQYSVDSSTGAESAGTQVVCSGIAGTCVASTFSLS